MKKSLTLFLLLSIPMHLMHPIRSGAALDPALSDTVARGVQYLETEQYDLALAEFEALREAGPTPEGISGIAACYIGIVQEELNDLPAATAADREALTHDAPPAVHSTAHLHLGRVSKQQGELTDAETHLQHAAQLLPDTAEVHIQLGDLYLLQHRLAAAAHAYRTAIRLDPDRAEPYYGLGRVAERQHRLQEAVTHYDAALSRNRYLAQAYYRQALTYRTLRNSTDAAAVMAQFQAMKRYEDTVHRYREALYTNRDAPLLYIKLGELHERHRNLSAATQVYRTATQVHPAYLPAHRHLGDALIKQRAYDDAATAYRTATELAPDDPKLWVKLGAIHINRQAFAPALAAFTQATVVDDTASEAYNNLARVHAGLGTELTAAIKFAKRAVALAPTARHYDTLAYAYYRNGHYAEAIAAIQEAIALAPEVDAYNNLLLKIQEAQRSREKERREQ